MRLIQLARLLQISPSQLEDFLKHRKAVFSGAHSRLADEDITAAVIHFAPEKLREVMASKDTDEEVEPSPVGERPEHSDDSSSVVDASVAGPSSSFGDVPSADSADSGVEVIRAPKVELPGLRVVGKIELPEPVKRESKEPSPEENNRPIRTTRQPADRRQRQPHRKENQRNPIQEKREREQREAEERRKEEIRQAKERRTLAYARQQAQREQKSVTSKSKQKQQTESSARPAKPTQRPEGWLGRFWRWLAHGE